MCVLYNHLLWLVDQKVSCIKSHTCKIWCGWLALWNSWINYQPLKATWTMEMLYSAASMHSWPQATLIGSVFLLSLTAHRWCPATACGDTQQMRESPLVPSPPIIQDWCWKFTQQTFLKAEMKEVHGSAAFQIGHTFRCHSRNKMIAGMELRLYEVNTRTKNNCFLNNPLRFYLLNSSI